MLVTGFPAAAFATNCYVVAPGEGEECVVVDPGIGVESHLAEVLARYRLRPAAVLVTHGHVDHVYAVTPVCDAHGVAVFVHPDDRYRMVDPLATLDPGLLAMFEQQFGAAARWREPDDVRSIGSIGSTEATGSPGSPDGGALVVAGLRVEVRHAPGHTEGSVMFRLDGAPDASVQGQPLEGSSTVLSGDVLFAGSIGRTDLPGGDHAAMLRSLRDQVLTLPDDTLVLPGHGPATTIGRERAANPYLAEVAGAR